MIYLYYVVALSLLLLLIFSKRIFLIQQFNNYYAALLSIENIQFQQRIRSIVDYLVKERYIQKKCTFLFSWSWKEIASNWLHQLHNIIKFEKESMYGPYMNKKLMLIASKTELQEKSYVNDAFNNKIKRKMHANKLNASIAAASFSCSLFDKMSGFCDAINRWHLQSHLSNK